MNFPIKRDVSATIHFNRISQFLFDFFPLFFLIWCRCGLRWVNTAGRREDDGREGGREGGGSGDISLFAPSVIQSRSTDTQPPLLTDLKRLLILIDCVEPALIFSAVANQVEPWDESAPVPVPGSYSFIYYWFQFLGGAENVERVGGGDGRRRGGGKERKKERKKENSCLFDGQSA